MMPWLQAVGLLYMLSVARQVAAVGEVGKGTNDCYASMPTDLPITISYSKSFNASATSFTFLVNVRFPTVTAFGIRLNDDLAVMSSRLSGTPEGQLVPQGPAYIWNITHTGAQMYTFTVNTTGLTTGTGPNSMPDLSDICAQGIQIADDTGNLIWQQPSPASSCVSWVKQGDECTFQSISQNAGATLSPKLNLPMYYSPPPVIAYSSLAGSPAAPPQSYGGYYAYPATAAPFSPSLSPATPLFGIQTTPAAYSPSLRPSAYSPGPVPYHSPAVGRSPQAPPSTLFGSPRVSSPTVASSSPYASPAPYAPSPYSPALSPHTSPSPYYGALTSGTYSPNPYSSPSRALLSAEPGSALGSAHLFGTRRLLASVPLVNKLVSPTCNLIGQQAEPACVQQGKCAHCFQKSIARIGLHVADITTVYNPSANQTSCTVSLDSTNTSLAVLDSILLRVTRSAHGTLLRAQPRESDLAPQADSESPITPQHLSRAHEDCSSNGLQSSVEWNQVELEGGKADLEVTFLGKIELFQDEVFIVDGEGQSTLLAEAGTAVLTVRTADECYFQTVSI